MAAPPPQTAPRSLAFDARVPLPPKAKGRPRVTRRGHAYTPNATRQWERAAADHLALAYEGEPLAGPLAVWVQAIYPRPKATPKSAPPGRIARGKRPDVDNVAKAALDAAQLAGVFVDDGQVHDLRATQWYAAAGEEACVVLTVWRIEG